MSPQMELRFSTRDDFVVAPELVGVLERFCIMFFVSSPSTGATVEGHFFV